MRHPLKRFLLQLLCNKKYKDLIRWTSNNYEFEILSYEEVAKLWGQHTEKPDMNGKRLRHCLYYHCDVKHIIAKVKDKKKVFKFLFSDKNERGDATNRQLGSGLYPISDPHPTLRTDRRSDLYDERSSAIQMVANPGCSSFPDTSLPRWTEIKRASQKVPRPQNEEPSGPSVFLPGDDIVSVALKSIGLPCCGDTMVPVFLTTEKPPRLLVISSRLLSMPDSGERDKKDSCAPSTSSDPGPSLPV